MIRKAAQIHARVVTIDSHVDTPLRLLRSDFDLSQDHEPNRRSGKLDLPRMKRGGLDAVFFAVFVGQGERNESGNTRAQAAALKVFDVIHDNLKKHHELAELALTPKDVYRLEKRGKRAILIGMENGYPIGNDLSLIRKYYDLGARYITLCHTKNNDICDSSTDTTEHHGLSQFGKQVIAEMNRIGMMIDISHVSDETFYDVIALSKAPIIASHSCARALCDHPRNLSDDMLKRLAENGGVIQMCLMSDYVKKAEPNPEREAAFRMLEEKYRNFDQLSEEEQRKARQEWYELNEKYPRELATVSDLVDHIDHIVKVAGIDHVGIGTDFDGGGGVEGCNDVSEMGNITLELVKRGYNKEQIRKIWGGNLLRVMTEVERIARQLQRTK
ncbi:MAG: dipeptidase [candidate division KSB1 bacterium]|nr:dipeptidase [candidate division KSB1 bacterium]MDZ7335110.1 dipeptidase [candidate division KSB1 bacterium]MDZ7356605.1 dipeptidase [candidate division KSB1 bacterium]MDZ7398959.1 dipeptidase [candidate division KSB1 bacterium]